MQQYAKIKSDTLVEFPYTFETLQKDNPHTQYDDRFSLPEWYQQTEDAIITGCSIVEVDENIPFPEMNPITQKLKTMSEPVLIGNKWVLGFEVIDKTQEEITSYQAMLDNEAVINGT